MKFTWDSRKEATHIAKHGVSFSEAQQAFDDPLAVVVFDETHSPRASMSYAGGFWAKSESE